MKNKMHLTKSRNALRFLGRTSTGARLAWLTGAVAVAVLTPGKSWGQEPQYCAGQPAGSSCRDLVLQNVSVVWPGSVKKATVTYAINGISNVRFRAVVDTQNNLGSFQVANAGTQPLSFTTYRSSNWSTGTFVDTWSSSGLDTLRSLVSAATGGLELALRSNVAVVSRPDVLSVLGEQPAATDPPPTGAQASVCGDLRSRCIAATGLRTGRCDGERLIAAQSACVASQHTVCDPSAVNFGTVTSMPDTACSAAGRAAQIAACEQGYKDCLSPVNSSMPNYKLGITQNTYQGSTWWGTIEIKNADQASSSSSYQVQLDVPSSAHCTADYVPPGATLSPLVGSGTSAHTSGNHCVFTWLNASPLAPGATRQFNYSTDSQSFTAATNVFASDACASETDALFCARLGKACGAVSGADNCGRARTVSSCGSCTAPTICGGGGTANVCGSPSCSFNVTTNTYDGSEWWGTITFKNKGPATSATYSVEFDVPSGVHCTADYLPPGAVLSPLTGSGSSAHTTGNHCVFTWTNAGTLAVDASKTFNYSTDSQSFSSASNVVASFPMCN
jgi:hypothetical protein